jgi:putative addiction module component (TIGR02574 family)
VALVEAIWDSIAESSSGAELSDAQKEILESRIDAYQTSPNQGSPWGEVRKRILKA